MDSSVRTVGSATTEYRRTITHDEVEQFATALEFEGRHYQSVEAAQADGFRELVVPLSYLLTFGIVPRSVKIEQFQIDESRAVVGEFHFQHFGRITAGETLSARCYLEAIERKDSGRSGFILRFKTPILRADGETALIARDSIIEFDQ